MPTQSIAFAPRRLSAERLDRIDADWRQAARLYDRPDATSGARELPPPEERFAYFVREMTPDGWLGIELSSGAGSGWLKADPEVGRSLRELLPELDFVEGAIGYLSYRQAVDGRGFPGKPAPWMLERIERRLARFIEPPGDASALALTLLGALEAFTTPDQATAGLERLREALRQQPEDGRLRNLVAMAELRQCCAGDGTGPALKQVPQMLLAGLAVDPNNAELLANLQATYAWLARQPGGAEAGGGRSRPASYASMPICAPGRAPMLPWSGLAPRGSRIRFTGTDPSGQWLRVTVAPSPTRSSRRVSFRISRPSGLDAAGNRGESVPRCAAVLRTRDF